MGHNVLGQTEGGNAVDEHAAGLVQPLKHGDLDAETGQITGTGDRGGAGTYAGHATTGLPDFGSLFGGGVVGHEALEAADGHRLTLFAENALALALLFLRAHAAAHAARLVDVALHHFGNEVGNGDVHGTAGATHGLFALKAAGGFLMGHFSRIPEGDFLEIPDAFLGSLAGHIMTGNLRPAGDFLTHDQASFFSKQLQR